MDMNEFKEKVERALEEYGGPEYRVRVCTVTKNNGLDLTGVSLYKPGSRITPTVYIDDYLKKYEKGMSFGSIINEIIGIMKRNEFNGELDVNSYTVWDKAKRHIVYRLINTRKNEQLLKEIPSVPFLDMSIVFFYLLSDDYFGNASIMVKNVHMKNWGVETDAVYSVAKVNTEKLLPGCCQDMEQLMKDVFMEDIKRKIKLSGKCDDRKKADSIAAQMLDEILLSRRSVPMYIMSNKIKYFGAASILYDGFLKRFAEEKDCNMFILPSSVHEVIILPDLGYEDIDGLKFMVSEVNRTQLPPDEVLSDSVYYYDKLSSEIRVLRGEDISAIA